MARGQEDGSLLGPYRVLDLTDDMGFMCGKVLADMGADVIKVERPGGDAARGIGPFYKDDPHPEKSLPWLFQNMNKRGVTLDVSSREGVDLVRRLVEGVDFVVESFEPGYLDGLGLGYGALAEINPRIILTSITPYGQSGPHARHKVADIVSMARGGLMFMTGDPDRPPVRLGTPQAALHGGVEGAAASMIAHYHRESTGEGQHVDVSIQECMVWTNMDATGYWPLLGTFKRRAGTVNVTPNARMRSLWPCKDGFVTFFVSGGGASQVRTAKALVEWMDEHGAAPDFLKSLDWATEYDRSVVTQDLVDRVEGAVQAFLMTKTKAELFDEGLKRQFRLGPVADARDIVESVQLAARDYFVDVEHPGLGGSIRYPGPFLKMSETPIVIRRPAPRVGEHNNEVFGRELGLSGSEIEGLMSRGVI
jgi:crotonobetainyl-CoA:carnitine CoA-transferase CaiB-like acyl-CoA transferase